MKNKKAQTIQQLIIMLIAVLVIIVVSYFVYTFFIKDNPGNIIPNLNGTRPSTEKIKIIRFNLENNSLEYFDGVNFFPFEAEKQKLDDIELSERNTLNDFNKYYLSFNQELRGERTFNLDLELAEDIYPSTEIKRVRLKELPEGIELRYNPSANLWEGRAGTSGNIFKPINEKTANGQLFDGRKIEGELSILLKSLVEKDILTGIKIIEQANKGIFNPEIQNSELTLLISGVPAGEVSAEIIDETNKKYAEVSLSQTNQLKMQKTKADFSGLQEPIVIPQNSQTYQEIAIRLIQWRDSVLEKPIKITDLNQEFCVRKINNYLAVNLAEPSSDCA